MLSARHPKSFLCLVAAALAFTPATRAHASEAGSSAPGSEWLGHAELADFPWFGQLASEFDDGSDSSCSATLISSQAVVTAAHCVARAGLRRAVFHPTGGLSEPPLSLEAATVDIHPKYLETGYDADIAVVHLKSPCPNPILPIDPSKPAVGTHYLVLGAGYTEAREESDIGVQRKALMRARYVSPMDRLGHVMTLEQLPGSATQVLPGDSGGAVVAFDAGPDGGASYRLVGIIHSSSATLKFCHAEMIAGHLPWIRSLLAR